MTRDTLLTQLSSYGNSFSIDEWPDYVGDQKVGAGDVDALIDIVTTCDLSRTNRGYSVEECVPRHAWRALGQLGACTAVPALLAALVLPRNEEAMEYQVELVRVLTAMGSGALAAMAMFTADESVEWCHKLTMLQAGVQMALAEPGAQPRVESMANAMLASLEDNDPYYNSKILTELFKIELADPSRVKEVIDRNLIDFSAIDGDAVREFIRVHAMYDTGG